VSTGGGASLELLEGKVNFIVFSYKVSDEIAYRHFLVWLS
jgi:3-phosphoglycerate kinase